jgi:hypothetical protein
MINHSNCDNYLNCDRGIGRYLGALLQITWLPIPKVHHDSIFIALSIKREQLNQLTQNPAGLWVIHTNTKKATTLFTVLDTSSSQFSVTQFFIQGHISGVVRTAFSKTNELPNECILLVKSLVKQIRIIQINTNAAMELNLESTLNLSMR